MSDILSPNKNISLNLVNKQDEKVILKISKALSSPERIAIMRALLYKSKGIQELSKELKMPLTSVMRHIDVLSDAQLIIINYQPGIKGHAKYCSQTILSYTVSLDISNMQTPIDDYTVEMPIGHFSHCHISTPCGINGKNATIGKFDDKSVFFMPERINAEQLWFDQGFISYNFPTPTSDKKYHSITFSFEVCSETTYFNNDWPSDISVFINDVEVVTFTSPGDFGGRRGNYTPQYWPITSTQFGLLKKITINEDGVFLDNKSVNKKITFKDLLLFDGSAIKLTIGIKDNAKHKGGINLFGKNFGDFNQAIVMKIK